jgi:two-component system chemotaxis response regulator CheY
VGLPIWRLSPILGANLSLLREETMMPKAMVVDDSKAIRMILSKTLAEVGYEVCEAANGREALEVFERERSPISLILVDWNMPQMDGLEFVKHLRADPRNSSVVLMMVTTETEIEQMVKALDAGANEYVMKPFTKEIIADKLRLLGVLQ